jgi:hypothetical protein
MSASESNPPKPLSLRRAAQRPSSKDRQMHEARIRQIAM